jgi:hypothetical protein
VNVLTTKDPNAKLTSETESIKKLSKTMKPRQIAAKLNLDPNVVRVIRSRLKKRGELPEQQSLSEGPPVEPEENEISGEAAIQFYNKLKNPPKNKKRDKMVNEALKMFPNPDQPQEIEIDLPDDL